MEEYSYTSTHTLGHAGPVTGSLYLYLYSPSITECVYFQKCLWKLTLSHYMPGQTLRPLGCLRLPEFVDNQRMKVGRLSALRNGRFLLLECMSLVLFYIVGRVGQSV